GCRTIGRRRGLQPRTELWLSAWAGGTAWLIHLLVAYGLGEFGCLSGWGKSTFAGVSLVAWLVLGASIIALAGAGWATWISVRARDRFLPRPGEEASAESAELGLAQTALIANVTFLAIIAVQTIPFFFFLREC